MERLDDLIAARCLPLAVLSDRTGLSLKALWKLRHGAVVRPHPSTLGKLSKALRVSPSRVRAAILAGRATAAAETD